MKIISNKKKLIKIIKREKNLGFIPTMGAIHKAHISMLKKCNGLCNKSILSIFINKPQFNKKSDFNKIHTVMEIGCGDGYFLKSLKDLGAHAIGYEPSSTYNLARSKEGINVVNDFFPFDSNIELDQKVDVVIMRHVLEHLASPRDALVSLGEGRFAGKSPEFLLIEVPNSSQLISILGRLLPNSSRSSKKL